MQHVPIVAGAGFADQDVPTDVAVRALITFFLIGFHYDEHK